MTRNALANSPIPSLPPGDRYRPSHHFTPQTNWMNDPNGLVYFDGEYHLFFQYNPQGPEWGHMNWGHAVSHDLVRWEELPVAIPETDHMVFSGCALIDWDNVSGLGDGKSPPMLAYYTAFDEAKGRQSQYLAYSHDRGRSFQLFVGNPVIDLDLADFRDPNVFYHAPSAAWVMVVALAREHRVQIYRSTNLIDWALASAFGPAGSTAGQWECPDLMLVPVEDHPGEAHWVMKVDVDTGFIGGGSGAQYFVGQFDGHRFDVDPALGAAGGDIVDHGPDFYAAVTWSDLPTEQPGPLWIGWMSNHQTGRFYPTEPWRGAQSLPRTLYLFSEGGMLKLGQHPVNLTSAAATPWVATPRGDFQSVDIVPAADGFQVCAVLTGHRHAPVTLRLLSGKDTLVEIVVDATTDELRFTRNPVAGLPVDFAFESITTVGEGDRMMLDLYFDNCLLEMFVNDGRRVFSACLFPTGPITVTVEAALPGVNIRGSCRMLIAPTA